MLIFISIVSDTWKQPIFNGWPEFENFSLVSVDSQLSYLFTSQLMSPNFWSWKILIDPNTNILKWKEGWHETYGMDDETLWGKYISSKNITWHFIVCAFSSIYKQKQINVYHGWARMLSYLMCLFTTIICFYRAYSNKRFHFCTERTFRL